METAENDLAGIADQYSEEAVKLRETYVELGQTQRRLEIALGAAQKAAAVDDLTGMMNLKSFRKEINEVLETTEQSGILIMIDGDHFKQVNDNYGHSVGDEVIKLTAQIIIGRIRTIDLASRLPGDKYSVGAKAADAALYVAKESHNGGFSC